jgi:hypothetical protein
MTSKKVREYLRSHVLGLVAIFIALTGTAVAGSQSNGGEGPKASASAFSLDKAKRQLKGINLRLVAVEAAAKVPGPKGDTGATGATGATGPSTGGAGGSLQGNYPNPTIAPNAVGSAELAAASVGGSELKGVIFVQGNPGVGFPVAAGTTVEASVDCPASHPRQIGGGIEWGNTTGNGTATISSIPNPLNPGGSWSVQGRIDTGGTANTLFPEVACIEA